MRVLTWVQSSHYSFFFITLNSKLYYLFILGLFLYSEIVSSYCDEGLILLQYCGCLADCFSCSSLQEYY